ncbi:hypothetical protein GCM10010236_55580 [Streptomyces eurythermus]|nr:hypothetical protein GCM10010236_55580 [Streptomyces eurythermus]
MFSPHAPHEVAAPRARLRTRPDPTGRARSGVLPDHRVRPRATIGHRRTPAPAHPTPTRGHRMGGIAAGSGVVRMGSGWQSMLAPVRCAGEGISK